ncbi:MAG: heme lyase CcmF/NrfE family subunit [SAR86 cluster bacterium]|jgi:cytochrome c-type biogenesis protein CcmF|nr:heme lyase CcmF/NrfE family subunit [SAR86 cluster bacterium]
MIAEIGHLLLIGSLVISFLAGFSPLLRFLTKDDFFYEVISPLNNLVFLLIFLSFVSLIYSFLIDDFSVAYIANNSNTLLPVYYKLAATWGAHEGSLLLWILCLCFWSTSYFFLNRKKDVEFVALTLSVLNQIIFAFIAFTLFTSNPFERLLPIAPFEGADLNPLLQDFAFTIHPPLLYLGYSGLAVPFALSLSALISKKIDSIWARDARLWSLLSSGFLTLGIALGSWWAYYELGWGGWWFWDPVENAAFVPWLISVAMFHSLIVTERRGLYKNWSILLSILAFAASILGTFLVRSGILTSVHAFALDPERGVFILAIFAYFILGSLIFYSIMNNKLPGRSTYNMISKEFGFLLNNILLVILAISIMFGTLFPLIYEAIYDGEQISVGAPYYEVLILPFAIALSFLQGVGLYLGWSSTREFNFLNRVLIESFSLFIVMSLLVFLIFGTLNWGTFLAIAMFSWIFSGNFIDMVYQSSQVKELKLVLLRRLGMISAHLGTAFLILGVGIVTTFSLEREVVLQKGESYQLGSTNFVFKEIRESKGLNYSVRSAAIEIRKGGLVDEISAEKRNYLASNQILTEAAIKPTLLQDYYVTLGDQVGDGKWSFKLQIKPFIRWIWFGAILIALGTFVSSFRQTKRL